MPLAEIIGGAAAFLTTASFLPQAAKIVRTRETHAISLTMYAMFTAGILCWGIYGVMTMQWSIIIANIITFVLASIILTIKVLSVLRPGASPGR
ncbi:MAG: glutathione synthetase [Sphingomonadales bacterium]|nr:MAG: glutathione synthetase [Sphingomonadales bacterium]